MALLGACGEQRFTAPEAPDFTLSTLDGGEKVSLREHRGDVVYLTFWASWCIPCRQEMPHLMRLWEQHRDDGFQVIGINVDDRISDPITSQLEVEGVLVLRVGPGTGAERAGLKETRMSRDGRSVIPGDVILSVDGRAVSDADSLRDVLSDYRPGDRVVLELFHDGAVRRAEVTLTTGS